MGEGAGWVCWMRVLGRVWEGCENLADRWVKEYLQEHNPSVSEIHNPCQIRGEDGRGGCG